MQYKNMLAVVILSASFMPGMANAELTQTNINANAMTARNSCFLDAMARHLKDTNEYLAFKRFVVERMRKKEGTTAKFVRTEEQIIQSIRAGLRDRPCSEDSSNYINAVLGEEQMIMVLPN